MGPVLSSKLTFLIFFLLLLSGLGFIYWVNGYINPIPKDTLKAFYKSPVTGEPVSFSFALTAPDDNSLVYNQNLLIQGKTAPEAMVLISTQDADLVITPDNKGNFSYTLLLDPGVNLLVVAAYDNSGNSKSEQRTIYYSKEKL